MQKRELGRTGLEVSVLGYGAGAVGGLFTKGTASEQSRAAGRAIDAGINYFDTASIYGNGESERNLGRALARLGRDHVDLLQLHNPLVANDSGDRLAIEIALAEVAPALEKLRKAGKTRFIGFSGVGEPPALHQAVESKLFDTVQVVYNALNPSAGGPAPKGMPGLDYGRLLDKAKAADMGTIIIRALAGGALSGTADRHPLAMQDVPPIGSALDFATDVVRARQLEPLVREAGAESLTELAERFVISHPAVSTMLIGYSTLQHLDEAIAAVNKGPLPDKVLKKIG